MSNNNDMFFGIFTSIILFLFAVVMGISNSCSWDKGYKCGQIDAITGNIKYKLTVNKDMTSSYKYIEDK